MARKVSLINMKGGVGKSTLATNIAWHFAFFEPKRVLVIDLDPQFNASQYLLGAHKYKEILDKNCPTVWDVFERGTRVPGKTQTIKSPRDVIQKIRAYSDGARLDLIPSRLELSLALRNPATKDQQLLDIVSEIESDYDLIIIDCAPTESVLTIAAYRCSDFLLVPVRPEFLSSVGLPLIVNSMEEYSSQYRTSPIEIAGIVFNATSNYSPEEMLSKNEVRAIAERNEWHVFKAEISYSKSYPKGAREGSPIFSTSYARTSQVKKFKEFAKEFATRIAL